MHSDCKQHGLFHYKDRLKTASNKENMSPVSKMRMADPHICTRETLKKFALLLGTVHKVHHGYLHNNEKKCWEVHTTQEMKLGYTFVALPANNGMLLVWRSKVRPGMSDVSHLCGISGRSFDFTLLSPLLFFYLVLLLFLSLFLPAGPFS